MVRRNELVSNLSAVARSDGKPDTVIGERELAAYLPIAELPDGDYEIIGIDLGDATRNVRPQDALAQIAHADRSPLTIEEGLAVYAADPSVIGPNRGFSLAGSSRGDRRVPALWISKGRPKLGWCFRGVPHTWLGTASCAARRPL